ncbi:Chitobiosyldiphosphodolichol beta-mannosyltransferase [Fasciola hepatica]|uniref:Chitobiosyldiphosphodolichol beta-mannosyltransferase n=1 Tax=Fasciola hepatica TaxID=6192 RepID=A0A4E0REF5_FASHE|nr:Chitobiosyldiphosphodolichol beta-mannosyltransferase [Fasciola hepatica]
MLQTSVHVIVLGDVTRSPRILSQACYLANEGYTVTVSGYDASLSVAAKTKNINALDLVNIPDLKKYLFLSSLSLIVKNLLRWNINAIVYYDRAPDDFASTPVDAAHELFTRLKTEYPALSDQVGSTRRTRFTEVITLPADCGGQITQWRTDRPALVLSSCSWTPDDDFTMMIEALDKYNERAGKSESELPHVVFAVTGRGPLKSYYEQLIREKCWTHVEVIMPWLTPEDYPVFLGCADLGISLHRSSSGLDLPMKVVDLMGVEVPVLALNYETLHELLPEHKFGDHFLTATELCNQLCDLLKPNQPKSVRKPLVVDRFDAIGSTKLRMYRDALSKYNRNTPRGLKYWKKVGAPPIYRALKSSL